MSKFKFLAMKQMIMTMAKASTLHGGWVNGQTSMPTNKFWRMLYNTIVDHATKFFGRQ
jgi:hypothetical protein